MGKEIKKMMNKKKNLKNTKKNAVNDIAKELSVQAKTLGIFKKAKTHKGRKILENKAPKIVENPK
jgi:hypothetical protein